MAEMHLDTGSEDWLAGTLGPAAARVLRAYAVRCLHHAHAAALTRYRLATWTNNNTYGTDRFHCFCSTFGEAVSARLPSTKVHRPEDSFGSPFLLDFGRGALYSYRYGTTADEEIHGLPIKSDSWIFERLVRRGPADQGVLHYPELPAIPLSKIVFLAWAGNRHEGLTRAFFGRPYIGEQDNRLYWLDAIEELDVEAGRNLFGLPPVNDGDFAPRHSLDEDNREVPTEPALKLTLLDKDSGLNLRSLFADGASDATPAPQLPETLDLNDEEDPEPDAVSIVSTEPTVQPSVRQ